MLRLDTRNQGVYYQKKSRQEAGNRAEMTFEIQP
jgi:hypothetical protein